MLCGMFAFSTTLKTNWNCKQKQRKDLFDQILTHITITLHKVLKVCVRLAWTKSGGMLIYLIQHGKCHFEMAGGHNYFYTGVRRNCNFELLYEAFNTCQSGAINHRGASGKLSEKLQRDVPAANEIYNLLTPHKLAIG